jgi:hypothetical protein
VHQALHNCATSRGSPPSSPLLASDTSPCCRCERPVFKEPNSSRAHSKECLIGRIPYVEVSYKENALAGFTASAATRL